MNTKTVVVTGCTGGLGQLLCEKLDSAGYRLALCSRSADKLEALVSKLKNVAVTGVFDIFDEPAVESFFNKVGPADILINLAGLSVPAKIYDTPVEAFDDMMDVNVKGIFLASKHYARQSPEAGLIINVGSMAARKANANAPIYCATKSAVNMLSDGMRLQLAEKNIRVTNVNPGGIDTPFWGSRTVNRAKMLTAEEVCEVIMFVVGMSPRIALHAVDFESFDALKQ